MKKTTILFTLMMLVFFVSQAQTSALKTTDKITGPEIQFNYTSYDYGLITKGEHDGNCEFSFKNTGTEPLVLSNVQASCGCTSPSWPREPILPGKSGVIKVHYNMNIGTFNKQITVTSNGKTDRVVLTVKGTVQNKPEEVLPEKKENPTTSPSK